MVIDDETETDDEADGVGVNETCVVSDWIGDDDGTRLFVACTEGVLFKIVNVDIGEAVMLEVLELDNDGDTNADKVEIDVLDIVTSVVCVCSGDNDIGVVDGTGVQERIDDTETDEDVEAVVVSESVTVVNEDNVYAGELVTINDTDSMGVLERKGVIDAKKLSEGKAD